jgi:hypothetical protein
VGFRGAGVEKNIALPEIEPGQSSRYPVAISADLFRLPNNNSNNNNGIQPDFVHERDITVSFVNPITKQNAEEVDYNDETAFGYISRRQHFTGRITAQPQTLLPSAVPVDKLSELSCDRLRLHTRISSRALTAQQQITGSYG